MSKQQNGTVIMENIILLNPKSLKWTGNDNTADCPPSSDFTWLFKSLKWRDGLYLWNKCQVTFDAALTDFNSRHCKTRMKKGAAQVDLCLFLNAALSCLQFGA